MPGWLAALDHVYSRPGDIKRYVAMGTKLVMRKADNWRHFSIRKLLLVVTATALLLGFAASLLSEYRANRRHWHAIMIEGDGTFGDAQATGPMWLRKLLPLECYITLGEISLNKRSHDDELLARLIPHMNGYDNFHALNLVSSTVTDQGLQHLRSLRFIQTLSLGGSNFTDAGLEHVAQLATLKTLHIQGTRITPSGIAQLKRSLPECDVRSDVSFNEDPTMSKSAAKPQPFIMFPTVLE